jgi:hypothetical protein
MTEKLAAALLEVDRLRALLFSYPRVCPYEEAKRLTAEQIIARWSFDHHPVRYVDREVVTSLGIPDIHHPANLSPTTRPEHARKTYEVDIPQNAKRKRIEKRSGATIAIAQSDAELSEMLRRAWDRAVPPRTKPSRWPPKGSRKIASRVVR